MAILYGLAGLKACELHGNLTYFTIIKYININ